ncbi:uncharacterized protein LOC100822799 [Brachypodium distachyon]|uniref:Uncharacterized protein n=1 Tax=Brachypodium distachyon TaxID=15368 RepID=I1IRP7_BRADI|nr:uncharacterized protein LOC100822799 [Brachypodium distachyon]KQJ90969.1 hypothetical protein BRADI_4g34890v3 [Brachypodium distachyon]|eukprot:XP_003578409.1 uncharacterized protein LOC100822799 [Brachypodium distachyon]
MKIAKAPGLLKKAAALCKSKTGVITARLLVLASPRRRMATVGAISHRIHAVMVADREKESACDKTRHHLVLRKVERKTPKIHGSEIVDFSRQLALFDQEVGHGDGGCPDWTLHPIFNDEGGSSCSYTEEDYEVDDDDEEEDRGVLPDALDDELSVMDVIRNSREVEGVEFNMEDEIDQAADMFIRRFRERMNQSF